MRSRMALRRAIAVALLLAGTACHSDQADSGPPARIAIGPSSLAVVLGASEQLSDTVLDASGNALTNVVVTWNSSVPSVATVTSSGRITAIADGTTSISATTGNVSVFTIVTVTPIPVASVRVTPDTATLVVATSQQLSAVALDAADSALTGRTAAWVTNDPSVATVTDLGLVSAIAPGSTTVTAMIEGHSASAFILVSAPPVASLALTPMSLMMTSGCVGSLSAVPRDARGDPVPGAVLAWMSSDTTIATVSQTGIVQGMVPGVAEITVTTQGQSAMAQVNVSEAQSTPGLPAC